MMEQQNKFRSRSYKNGTKLFRYQGKYMVTANGGETSFFSLKAALLFIEALKIK